MEICFVCGTVLQTGGDYSLKLDEAKTGKGIKPLLPDI
jgi:hypothetical protein